MTSTTEDLLAAIGDQPAERANWYVLADALDEQGDHAQATSWRWMADNRKYPEKTWHKTPKWCWWCWMGDDHSNLPSAIFMDPRLGRHNSPLDALTSLAEVLADKGVPAHAQPRD